MEYLRFYQFDPSITSIPDKDVYVGFDARIYLTGPVEKWVDDDWILSIEYWSRYQRVLDPTCGDFLYAHGLIVKKYHQELINNQIKQWIAECNAKARSEVEAYYYLTDYMDYLNYVHRGPPKWCLPGICT